MDDRLEDVAVIITDTHQRCAFAYKYAAKLPQHVFIHRPYLNKSQRLVCPASSGQNERRKKTARLTLEIVTGQRAYIVWCSHILLTSIQPLVIVMLLDTHLNSSLSHWLTLWRLRHCCSPATRAHTRAYIYLLDIHYLHKSTAQSRSLRVMWINAKASVHFVF